ncbi:MAG: SpoIID/LytB domain-containing protein [Peptococcaceae bacterium]|nr:SpoIID/LytB domain-containing protein [Peptococcaceae bacterium]
MRTMLLTTLVLIIVLLLTSEATANPTISIGWSEQHGAAEVSAEFISWRNGQQIVTRNIPDGASLRVALVIPRKSILNVESKAAAIWMQHALQPVWATRIVRSGSTYALMLLGSEQEAKIPWEMDTCFAEWTRGSTNTALSITFDTGETVYTLDRSVLLKSAIRQVQIGAISFRGDIVFNPNRSNVLTSINVLKIEDYLRGVVPNEMPASWPLEALKAQALAARSYAVRQFGKHRQDGFDLCSTVHCQAFAGASSEHPQSDRAVAATKGEVITYGGTIIDAVYHAHSGGHTRNSEYVWGGVVSYLKGVAIPEEPPYTWTRRITVLEFERRIRNIAPVLFVLSVNINSYADTNHVNRLTISSLSGNHTISAQQLRSAMNAALMRSTKFDILLYDRYLLPYRATSRPELFAFEVGRVGGIFHGLLPTQPAFIEFVGRGFGHGVGMSQWGAYGLALNGENYQDIVRRFYTGVRLTKAW